MGFDSLDIKTQLNLLVKSYFFVKSEKDNYFNKIRLLEEELVKIKMSKDETNNNIYDNLKQENYILRCELEKIQLSTDQEREITEKVKKEYVDKKEKLKEEVNFYKKLTEEKNKQNEIIQNQLDEMKQKVLKPCYFI